MWTHSTESTMSERNLARQFLEGTCEGENVDLMSDIRNTNVYKEALLNITSVRQCISIFTHMFSDGKENLGRYLVWITLSFDVFSKLSRNVDKTRPRLQRSRSLD